MLAAEHQTADRTRQNLADTYCELSITQKPLLQYEPGLCRWYELVLAAEDDIATIMTMEGGKPLKESKGEFASG